MRRRNGGDNVTRSVETAVRHHSPALTAYFARRVHPSHEAADLLAETLLVLWRRAASIPKNVDQVRPWMFGIARNVLMHHYRGQVRQETLSARLRNILATTPHPGFSASPEFDELHIALEMLDPLDREIIGLLHWDGFSLVEIAVILRKNESTVRSRYHRARKFLQVQLAVTSPTQIQEHRRGAPTSH